ncbi:hypothetical protein JCM3770_002632, partial [Rhodotorula araucariae]
MCVPELTVGPAPVLTLLVATRPSTSPPAPGERSPLLPTRTLNPRAPVFQRPHPVVAPSAAFVAAAPDPLPARDADSPAPSTSSLLAPTPGRTASTSPHPHPHSHLHAHFLSSPLLAPRSPSPASSVSSFSSRYSLLPLRTFQRLHLIQFALAFLFLFVVPVAVVVALAHQFRWEAFLLGVASWLAAEQLREVVFELFTPAPAPTGDEAAYDPAPSAAVDIDVHGEPFAPVPHAAGTGAARVALPTVVHALAQEALRLGAVALVVKLLPSPAALAPSLPSPLPPSGRAPLPPLDPLFWSALWLALGSALTEILWGSRRLWNQLELYEDVLPADEAGAVDEERVLRGVCRGETDENTNEGAAEDEDEGDGSVVDRRADGGVGADLLQALERDDAFQLRLRALQRAELEAQLGVPLFEIPVGVVMIWRLDRYIRLPLSNPVALRLG